MKPKKEKELEISVMLTESEWYWLIKNITSYEFLREKIFRRLVNR